jgi:hypothetical protein
MDELKEYAKRPIWDVQQEVHGNMRVIITRVPGGIIYTLRGQGIDGTQQTVLVPLSQKETVIE